LSRAHLILKMFHYFLVGTIAIKQGEGADLKCKSTAGVNDGVVCTSKDKDHASCVYTKKSGKAWVPAATYAGRLSRMRCKIKGLLLVVIAYSILSADASSRLKGQAQSKTVKAKTVAREADTPNNIRKVFQVNCKTYVLSEDTMPFETARSYCQRLNGDLASGLNYDDFDKIVKHLTQDDFNGDYIWVGAKRNGEDTSGNDVKTDVYWLTGEPIPPTYKKWWPRSGDPEPDSHCCGCIYKTGYLDGHAPSLATYPGDGSFRALCQIY